MLFFTSMPMGLMQEKQFQVSGTLYTLTSEAHSLLSTLKCHNSSGESSANDLSGASQHL